jgi:hypothetical protein
VSLTTYCVCFHFNYHVLLPRLCVPVLEHVTGQEVSSLLELLVAHAQQGNLPGPAATQAVIGRLTANGDIAR